MWDIRDAASTTVEETWLLLEVAEKSRGVTQAKSSWNRRSVENGSIGWRIRNVARV
jgi:hypothetical protein